MKFFHYFCLILVAIILSACILLSLIIASFCFNPSLVDLLDSGTIEFTSYNVWLICSFVIAIIFVYALPPFFKLIINWFKSQFNKLKDR